MEEVLDVANYIFNEYRRTEHDTVGETRLHKLLYLVQRETIAVTGHPMFDAPFEAWANGPVCVAVRARYTPKGLIAQTHPLSAANEFIVNCVMMKYKESSTSKLCDLSHRETSWINARGAVKENQICTNELDLNDIREDAKRVDLNEHIPNELDDGEFTDEEWANATTLDEIPPDDLSPEWQEILTGDNDDAGGPSYSSAEEAIYAALSESDDE